MPTRRSPASWAPTCSGASSPSSSGCRTTPASRSRTPPPLSSSSSGSRAGSSIWFRRSATLALALAVYRTGVVLFGRGAGLLGVLFTTVVSAYAAANYTLARAYYVEHLLVGQVVLLGAALWLARPLSEPARCRVAIAMGLAGGLGLYFNFQIVDALIPALLALLLVEPRLPFRRAAWLGVGAFLLGSLPFWAYNLTHDWATVATGARYQGHLSGLETARILVVDLLPVVLGVRSGTDQPAHLPGPLAWTIPLVVGGAVLLLAARVVAGLGRLRRDSARAGEALLLAGIAVTLGVVWYGGYVRVPRYLLPLIPLLALVLARAAQLTWRWTRAGTIVWVAVYLVAVGMDLAPDITALRPEARIRYRQEREADARLFDVTPRERPAEGLRLRLLAGPPAHLRGRRGHRRGPAVQRPLSAAHAGGRPVASARIRGPGGGRDLPSLAAPRRASRPGRTRPGGTASFTTSRRRPTSVPCLARPSPSARAPGQRRCRERARRASSTRDGRASRARTGSAWIEVDLDAERLVSGVTLINDHAERVPDQLVVMVESPGGGARQVAALAPLGVASRWENGAIRIAPSRTLTVRFEPGGHPARPTRREGAAGQWSVAELFLLGPAPPESPPDAAVALVQEGRRLEEAGQHRGRRSCAITRRCVAARTIRPATTPFARLTTLLRASTRSPLDYATRLADLGLLTEARTAYADAARALGPDQVHAELWRLRARLAAADGDTREATRLAAEADAALAPGAAGRRGDGGPGRAHGLRHPAAAAPGRRARRDHDPLAPAPGALGTSDGLGAPPGRPAGPTTRAPGSGTTTRWSASCPSSAWRRST